MLKATITVKAHTAGDLDAALAEAVRLIAESYVSGSGTNEHSSYDFLVVEGEDSSIHDYSDDDSSLDWEDS